jgi:hypothetical protein
VLCKSFAAFAGDSKWQSKLSSYLKFAAPLRLHPSEARGAACAGAGPCERPTSPPPSQGVSRPAARREQHQTSVSIRAFLSASPMTRTV